MKKIASILLAALLLAACTSSEERLMQRAAELCRYVPDHQLLPEAASYMTADFYAVLDTLFNRLPEFETLDHEWLYYFVTGNGGTIADFTVTSVELSDSTHAVATVSVRQKWEDGTIDTTTGAEQHKLYMEKVGREWLMADFDGHKADCIRHIAINRSEQQLRNAIACFLVDHFGSQYTQADVCIPVLAILAEEESETEIAWVWGDFWVYNYQIVGDTLKTVSGGNHSGRFHISEDDTLYVTGCECPVDGAGHTASAKRLFGPYYDQYQTLAADDVVREAIRKEQLCDYVRRHNLPVKYYQDYGWPPTPIE